MRRLTTYPAAFDNNLARLKSINDKLTTGLYISSEDQLFYNNNYKPSKTILDKYEEDKKKVLGW